MSDVFGTIEKAASATGAILRQLLQPLESGAPGPGVKALVAQLGWALPDPVPPALLGLKDAVTTLVHDVDQLQAAVDTGASEADVATAAGQCVAALIRLVQAFADLPAALGAQLPPAFEAATDFKDQFASRLIDVLVAGELLRRLPGTARVLRLLGLLEVTDLTANPATFQPQVTLRRMRWDRIGSLMSDPVQHFQTVYGWGTPSLNVQPLQDALYSLSMALGHPALIDYPSPGLLAAVAPGVPNAAASSDRIIELILFDTGVAKLSAGITTIPKANPGELQGLAIALNASGSLDKLTYALRPNLSVTLSATLDASAGIALAWRPGQTPQLTAGYDGPRTPVTDGQLIATLSYRKLDGEAPFTILAFPGGSRVEAREMYLTTGLSRTKAGELDPQVEAGLKTGKLIISLKGADGFLSTLLPGNVTTDFDFGLGWSRTLGIYVQGQAGLELSIPLHVDIGPVSLEYLFLRFAAAGGALSLETSVGAKGSLGPLAAVIDRVGLTATATFPPGGGNVGPAQLDLAFKPPNGVGLSLDTGVVKGGGFLYIDADRGEYAGAIELVFADFLALHAIGLINTKLPDGSSGFSLLVIITADFGPGIQLGFGFTLLAVGGLLGLNRTMLLQPLLDGVRTDAIESIMFPHDVVANAQRILSDLRRIFPPQPGTFLIGPMAKLGWGEPTLVSLSLGIMIEIPGNAALLGVLKIALPADEIALIVLQVNFTGVIEFDKSRLYFFAALFDSRVLFITIEGEMGVLFGFGADANFVLSVGGFHPKFNPPPLPFPAPRRIELDIINESYARIRCDGYFAVTTNTVQFGSHSEYFFGFSACSLEGHSGFDALIQFSPFHFSVEISTSFSVKVFGIGVYGVGIDLTLEGPAPWHAHGTASLSFFFFSIDIGIDFTWGDSRDTSLPPVPVMPILVGELGKQSNWRALLPSRNNLLVSLRQLDPSEAAFVLHPVGTLHVSQRAIPLDLSLDKVGSQKPSDARRFTLTASPGPLSKLRDVDEQFAPAQFKDGDDATRLSEAAYVPQHGGIELTVGGSALASGTALTRVVRYDLTIIDTKLRRARQRFYLLVNSLFMHFLRGSSVTRNAFSAYGQALTHPFADAVKVAPESFVVASQSDNRAYAGATESFTSQMAATDFIARTVSSDPSLAGTLHVLPQFEVAA